MLSCKTCSLSRYNAEGELDCFNCKTGVFSDYYLQYVQKRAIVIIVIITIHFFAKKIQLVFQQYLTIIKKNKVFSSIHCCIDRVWSNIIIMHQSVKHWWTVKYTPVSSYQFKTRQTLLQNIIQKLLIICK